MKIKIEETYDEYDCETCGVSYSDGAIVYFDDEIALTLEPIAHCYGGQHWSAEDIYRAILEKLGHEVQK